VSELKKCPFCGGTNLVKHSTAEYHWIHCEDCSAYGPLVLWSEDEKIVWNTRHVESELHGRIVELEAYADKLAAGLPEGMLPKDVEIIREANWEFAQRIAALESQVKELEIASTELIGYIKSGNNEKAYLQMLVLEAVIEAVTHWRPLPEPPHESRIQEAQNG